MPTRALALLLFLLFAGAAAAEDDPTPPPIVLTDVSESAGVSSLGGDRFSFGDYDGDGDPDLLVNGSRLLRNDISAVPNGKNPIHFTDVSKETGIDQGPGGGACWVDMDGDGDLDVVTQNGALKLQVSKGHFEDHAAAWGLPKGGRASAVGVGDVDGDGWPDVLFGGAEDWNGGKAKFYPRRLYRNVDGKRFEDVSKAHALSQSRYGRAVVWADFDTDGDQDVYMGNYRLQPNELLVNEDGILTNRGEERGVQGRHEPDKFADGPTGKRFGYRWGHTIASSWADLDGDGDLDLWVSNLVHKFVGFAKPDDKGSYDIRGYLCDDSALYRNDGGPGHTFTDVRAESGIPLRPMGDRSVYRGDELWSNAACGDLDGDGLPEVYVAQVYQLPYSHGLLYRNKGGFTFEEVSGAVKLRRFNSYGGAFADLDLDGDLDLVCGGSPSPKGKRSICVLRNDTESGPWIGFRLRGRAPATTALGAQITVFTDKGALVRQVESCMGSHAQQNENVLRFGLRGRTLEAVVVRWPGNILQTIAPPGGLAMPPTGRVHTIEAPKRLPPRIKVTAPETGQAGEPLKIRVKAKGARGKRWRWSASTGPGGAFEPLASKGVVTAPGVAPVTEVRIRLTDTRANVCRETVVRVPTATESSEKSEKSEK